MAYSVELTQNQEINTLDWFEAIEALKGQIIEYMQRYSEDRKQRGRPKVFYQVLQ